jgi:hypothetical protein
VKPQVPRSTALSAEEVRVIAKANEGITHAEFAAGAQSGTMGFHCFVGEPRQFYRILQLYFAIALALSV